MNLNNFDMNKHGARERATSMTRCESHMKSVMVTFGLLQLINTINRQLTAIRILHTTDIFTRIIWSCLLENLTVD